MIEGTPQKEEYSLGLDIGPRGINRKALAVSLKGLVRGWVTKPRRKDVRCEQWRQ